MSSNKALMKLPLYYYGNSVLRKKTSPVTEVNDEIRSLINDMDETMKAHNGIGISAPQIGKSLSIFITSYPIEDEMGNWTQAPSKVFINAHLYDPSVETWVYDEGCLSIPKLYWPVERPVSITVTALDIEGKEFTERLTGWAARVCMHENDHINGVLFVDRIHPKDKRMIEDSLRKIKKQYNP